jgi:hypothetical protein
VRIADFGLSRIFSGNLDIKTFQGGSLFYMAPELLNGTFHLEKGNKADAYAFGILLNELITEDTPYKFFKIEKVELFRQKVLSGEDPDRNRPQLPDLKILELEKTITSCWKSDPDSRPTFSDLKKSDCWQKIRAKLGDGNKLLSKIISRFDEEPTMSFLEFLSLFSDQFAEDRTRGNKQDIIQNTNPYIRTLQVALGITNVELDKVQRQAVTRLSLWLNDAVKREALDNLYVLFTDKRFFGTLTDEESLSILRKGANKAGTYLVRWSDKRNKFVLDYITKTKVTATATVTATSAVSKKSDSKKNMTLAPSGGSKKAFKAVEQHELPALCITDLLHILPQHTRQLKLSGVADFRPPTLEALKIKDRSYLHSASNYAAHLAGSDDITTADLSRSNALVHFEFIL